MRFCPYCGAPLVGSAASFCSECGKQLPRKTSKLGQDERKQAAARKGSAKRAKKGKGTRPLRDNASRPKKAAKRKADDNYDGYYNDIQPVDADIMQDRLDPDLIKRIVFLALGALGVIILSASLMALL